MMDCENSATEESLTAVGSGAAPDTAVSDRVAAVTLESEGSNANLNAQQRAGDTTITENIIFDGAIRNIEATNTAAVADYTAVEPAGANAPRPKRSAALSYASARQRLMRDWIKLCGQPTLNAHSNSVPTTMPSGEGMEKISGSAAADRSGDIRTDGSNNVNDDNICGSTSQEATAASAPAEPLTASFGVSAHPVDDDLFHWHAVISGPVGSPWEGGLYRLNLEFDGNYPVCPPKISFLTANMFHPNIYVNGDICLDLLKDRWNPLMDVQSLLISIMSLLSDPNPLSAANADAARVFLNERMSYNQRVRQIAEDSLDQSFSDLDNSDDDSDDTDHR